MLKKKSVTKAGDVYQVGVVLYEMLVGISPYYNDSIKILYQNIEKGKFKLIKPHTMSHSHTSIFDV